MSAQTYEFTAFSEQELLRDGDGNLNRGDSFTMPSSADVCITVTDNDPFLSGDCYDRARDHSGQHASIEGDQGELGNGGQIYAEKYFWACDTDGNWYVLIEIEQEGTNDDYFTFYNGHGFSTPEPGTELTLYGACNVRGNWVDYKCLDAGDKEASGTITGTVFCDLDCDGINGTTEVIPGCDYTIEAEDMYGYGFQTVSGSQASNGELVKLWCAGSDGALCKTFDGKDGVYDLKIRVQDETDGKSTIKVNVNGNLVEAIRLDAQTDGAGSNNGGFSTYVIKDVALTNGDDLSLEAWGNGHEFVRIDKIDLEGQDEVVRTSEPPKDAVIVKLVDAATGDVVATTITKPDGSYTFDGIPVGDYRVMGVAPDGTEFTIQDAGSDDTIDSDVNADGLSDVITVTADSETTVDIGLKDAAPEPGALSGTYFCDENRNAVDDSTDADVIGKTVTLFTAAGVQVATTTTDSTGDYIFTGLDAGDYYVVFEDSAAQSKSFVAQNAGNDDTVDSDVDATGRSDTVTVVAGEETKDVDAGVVEDLGSLSGRVFCDDNRNAVDDAEPGVERVTVSLIGPDGTPTGDTVVTTSNGEYSFTGLVAGTYSVQFTYGGTKSLVAPDAGMDDAIDSDATDLGGGVFQITGIDVLPGQDTPDNDVGLEVANDGPETLPDQAKTCADDVVVIDLLGNDSDANGDTLTITEINGLAITDGVPLTLSNNVVVTLVDGKLEVDGEAAFAFLDIGEASTANFTYTISDGMDSTSERFQVTFCGDANSLASFEQSLPSGTVTYQVRADGVAPFDSDAGFDIKVSGTGDVRFDGVVFEQAYCLSILDPADAAESFATASLLTADIYSLDEAPADLFNANQVGIANGETAADNMDIINWMLNQNFEDQGFTGWEVQRAIWEFTDGFDTDFQSDIDPIFGDDANVDILVAQALANGDGFQAGVGDVIGVILDPNPVTDANSQPFILAVDFESFDCLCGSDDFVFV
ncbi:MAG: SdrD B-like domain-containing protein [Pseudomonadota bacterium]